MKKLFALLLALTMVFSLAATAFAEETDTTYSITINNATDGYTYGAWQIFTGDLSEGTLSNVAWGSHVTNVTDGKLVKQGSALNGLTASQIAERMGKDYVATAEAPKITLEDLLAAISLSETTTATSTDNGNTYVINGLVAGYYLVKNTVVPTAGAYTDYIVQVVDNVEMAPKGDAPKIEKKVKDINDSTEAAASDWQDSADHDIGDTINYKITVTMPSTLEGYSSYKMKITDTISKGLTYNENATVKVYNGDTEVTTTAAVTTLTAEYTGSDTKYTGGKVLTFDLDAGNDGTYDAIALGIKAGYTIVIEYSATLNDNAVIGSVGNPNVVDLDFSNNPNKTDDMGSTPEDVVIVFTYKLVINKTDSENKALTGAEFKLEKKQQDGNWKEITLTKSASGEGETAVADSVFSAKGLDDGEYKISETTTPAGYNSIDPIEFKVEAGHVVRADNPTLNTLTGTVTTGEISFTADTANGSLTTSIVNKSGTELPETGGMGTTLFYIVGGIMVAAAVVLLVTKKRMGAEG